MRLPLALWLVALAFLLVGCGQDRQVSGDQSRSLRIILQAEPLPSDNWPADAAGRKAVLEEAREVILRRVKQVRGVAEPTVSIEGDNKLVVELPGDVSGAEAVAAVTASSHGSLEFYHMSKLQSKRNPIADWSVDMVGASYVFTGPNNKTIDSVKQPKEVLSQVVGAPKVKPVLTGKDLVANATANINARNEIVINIQFDKHGKKVFADFTRNHVGEYLAIFYEGKLLTCPIIKDAILGGSAEISGFSSLSEGRRAANALNAGRLPVALKVITRH